MTDANGTRMDRLAEMADVRTRQLSADENAHRRAREDAEAQLRQLKQYRADYTARFEAGGRAWQGRAMEDFRRFLDRLDRAIREQDALVRQAASSHEASTASVRESWRSARAFGRLAERVATERRQLDARREQLRDDELAMRGAAEGTLADAATLD